MNRGLKIAWKDLLIEWRRKEGVNALAFFAGLLLFLFYFAFGPDPARILAALPGLLWLAFLLAGLLAALAGAGPPVRAQGAGGAAMAPAAAAEVSASAQRIYE
ncbi:MAG: heme exporter protein CcmB, partial [Candidatus Methylomirabilales bacterium]